MFFFWQKFFSYQIFFYKQIVHDFPLTLFKTPEFCNFSPGSDYWPRPQDLSHHQSEVNYSNHLYSRYHPLSVFHRSYSFLFVKKISISDQINIHIFIQHQRHTRNIYIFHSEGGKRKKYSLFLFLDVNCSSQGPLVSIGAMEIQNNGAYI